MNYIFYLDKTFRKYVNVGKIPSKLGTIVNSLLFQIQQNFPLVEEFVKVLVTALYNETDYKRVIRL